MAFADRPYAGQVSFGPGGGTPSVIKWLLLANGVVWLGQIVWIAFLPNQPSLSVFLGISHAGFVEKLRIWQPFTYMFLHSAPNSTPPGDIFHILFNMFLLWMFGGDVARRLGTRSFLKLYLGAGLTAGVAYAIFALVIGMPRPCIGASGAVLAVVIYAALLEPHRTVLLLFVIPVKFKTMAWLIVGLDLFYVLFTSPFDSDVAHIAHLGGVVFAYVFFRYGHAFDRWSARREIKAEQGRLRKESDMRVEVDRLLEKIHQEGLGSLTDREKKFLKRSSSRFEKKR